jgi:imidazolonepropionase-like amidohydrolase
MITVSVGLTDRPVKSPDGWGERRAPPEGSDPGRFGRVTAPASALHVRGIVLPQGERRDVYTADGVVADGPVAGATLVAEGWVVPGLVDAHCHIGLGPQGAVDRDEQERQALTDRDAGTLLARDCGVASDTRWIDGRADLPRIIRAGRHLARPRRYMRNYGIELEPDALPDAAAEQARRGDGWVKIVGDWIDRERGDLAPCWPSDALARAVARAHDAGARVTTHVFGEEALPDLVAAGVDCLEHGTGLSDELIAVLAARGVALVPTLINIDSFPSIADRAVRFPAYAEHMRRLHARSRSTVRAAYDAGVAIFAGTDAGGGLAHGRIADEVRALHGAGLPAEEALGAASWRARAWLGLPPALLPGTPAELVVYAADPRADLGVLAAPARIVLRGRVVR